MGKPDKVLRVRPLREVQTALEKLKRVVLVHPEPIVVEVPSKYCVCKKGERKRTDKTKLMIQCDECWDWFHFDCVQLKDDADVKNLAWKCEWCLDTIDEKGYQRWTSNRKLAKKRHYKDTPRRNGGVKGGNPPQSYSAPPDWDGKVAEIKEIARRAAIKKKKLTDAVEKLVEEGGHHLVDAVGMAGLDVRAVDEAMIDEMLGEGLVEEDEVVAEVPAAKDD
jgi:PHD-finger